MRVLRFLIKFLQSKDLFVGVMARAVKDAIS